MKNYLIYFLLLSFSTCQLLAQPVPTYKDPSATVEERVQDLLQRMTLQEKIAQMRHVHAYSILTDGKIDEAKLDKLLGGQSWGFIEAFTLPGKESLALMNATQKYMKEKTRWGIPAFTVSESLHGSVHDGSTIFPQSIAIGSTFNPLLAYEMTAAIASELSAQGITQSLTPVIDVCRDLRWGRVEECFGEDPFLVTSMGLAEVRGYLDHQVSPMLKHFGAHGAPTGGLNLASVACGERELLSIYLSTFEKVVKEANPWAVMSSYNSWNGEPNSSSHYLMTELLRNQWGFKGYVYSDWGAIGMLNYFHHTASNGAEAAMQALMAGLDAEASDDCYEELPQLVEQGLLDVKYIDQAVAHILTAKFNMGLFERQQPEEKEYDQRVHTPSHVALARKIAEESIVLLENRDHLLPLRLKHLKSIAVIGPNANQVQFGDYTWSRDNKDGVTLLQALRRKVKNRIEIHYAEGCDLVTDQREGFQEAVEAAKKSDLSIVVVGSASASLARDYRNATCGEGFDLSDLTLTGVQEELVKAVYETGKPVVVVLLAGKPFVMPWIKEHIPAIVVQWYPGEQGGNALADMLLGEVNPSGKLNYSFPQSVGHLPCFYNHLPTDKGFYHRPGEPNKPGKDYVFSSPAPLWAFGHGLSYTEFEYLSATTSKEDYQSNELIEVHVTIKNSGLYDGMEVPQIYVRDVVSSVVTPVKELKGFTKVWIKKGETKQVSINIPVSELALYNKKLEHVVEPGAFELMIGRASDDIRIKKMITVERQKESIIPTRNEQANALQKDKSRSSIPVIIKGTLRDVQANRLPGVTVRVGTQTVVSNEKGEYTVKALSTDTLSIGGGRYQMERIPIDGRLVINAKLRYQ